jgi:hypothetical protein
MGGFHTYPGSPSLGSVSLPDIFYLVKRKRKKQKKDRLRRMASMNAFSDIIKV